MLFLFLVKSKLFSKMQIFVPSTTNPYFQGIIVTFNIEISKLKSDISTPSINHSLDFSISFPTMLEQMLSLFQKYWIYNFCPKIEKIV